MSYTKQDASRPKPQSLREKQKEDRRNRISVAMMELLSTKSADDITNGEIAERAGVTIPTIYNLIGGRSDILVHLLNKVMADLRVGYLAEKELNPLDRAERVGAFLVGRFTSQEEAYRQVIRGVNSVPLPSLKPYETSPHRIYLELMREAEAERAFVTGIGAVHVANLLFQIFAGALITWAIEGLTKAEFSAQVTDGFHVIVAAVCTDTHRKFALQKLKSKK